MDCEQRKFAPDQHAPMPYEIVITTTRRIPCRSEEIAEIMKRKFEEQHPDATIEIRPRGATKGRQR